MEEPSSDLIEASYVLETICIYPACEVTVRPKWNVDMTREPSSNIIIDPSKMIISRI